MHSQMQVHPLVLPQSPLTPLATLLSLHMMILGFPQDFRAIQKMTTLLGDGELPLRPIALMTQVLVGQLWLLQETVVLVAFMPKFQS